MAVPKEKVYENALKENQALALAKEIAADPDLMNYVTQVVRNAKMEGQRPQGGEKPPEGNGNAE